MPQTLFPFSRMITNAMAFRPVDLHHQCNSIMSIWRGEAKNDPVSEMWRGHVGYFLLYSRAVCLVHGREAPFIEGQNFMKQLQPYHETFNASPYKRPAWLGDPWLHRSHRSILLSYDFEFYQHKFPGNPLKMPMLWPRFDDTDSRGYRLYIQPRSKIVLDKGLQKMPAELRLTSDLEVLEA